MIRICPAPARAALLALLALGAARGALAQETPGIRLTSDAVEVDIGGRLHTQFNTTSIDSEPDSELLIRRARLEIGVKLNDVVSGAIHPEFGQNRVTLKDAFLQLDLSPSFGILAGKAYKPFSRIEQTSSTRILTVERGAAIRGMDALDEYEIVHALEYSDRDVGVQVMGEPAWLPLGLSYQAGVFQGPLHNEVGNVASYQYAGQLRARPIAPLEVGGAWSSRHFVRGTPGSADYRLERGHAFELDAELGSFAPGFHLIGEVAFGDADATRDADFLGAHLWAAYRTEPISSTISAVEPVLRISRGQVDDVAALGTDVLLFTPGLNVHFGGRNRIMVNYDIFRPDGGGLETSFKTMFALAF